MHIITRRRLNEFAENHPDTENAPASWYRSIKQNNFANLAELKAMFPTADKVGKLTVLTSAETKFVLSRRFIIIVEKFIFAAL